MDLEAIRDGVRAALVEKGIWQRLRADLRTHVHGIVAGTSGGKAAAAEAAAAFRSSEKGERAENNPKKSNTCATPCAHPRPFYPHALLS